jgi:hypothetical protein
MRALQILEIREMMPKAFKQSKVLEQLHHEGGSSVTIDEFNQSLEGDDPPAGISHALAAMWYDAKDEWDAAHREAQAQEDASGAWVHAYLHRVEGDESNAAYWYRRAGRPVCSDPLHDEWTEIVTALLRTA